MARKKWSPKRKIGSVYVPKLPRVGNYKAFKRGKKLSRGMW